MVWPRDGGGDLVSEGHGYRPSDLGTMVSFHRQQQGLLKPAENTGFCTQALG